MATVEDRDNKVYYVITGFSAFGSVGVNPTAKLIEVLSDEASNFCLTHSYKNSVYIFEVLEVSVQAVDFFVNKTVDSIVSRDGGGGGNKSVVYFIHLGVDENATSIKLEQVCYNNLNFRIPDVQGYQPQNLPLFDQFECDYAFSSQVGVEQVLEDVLSQTDVQAMQQRYTQPLVTLSTNPGRYLCNYIYLRTNTLFRACHVFQTNFSTQCECSDLCRCTSCGSSDTGNVSKVKCKSIFVHVPLFSQIALEDQLALVMKIIASIQRH
eukprot:gene29357-35439_t